MRRLKQKEVAKFLFGAALFSGGLVLRLLDSFQRLDYVKTMLPGLYAWIVSPSVQFGTVIVGLGVMAAGVNGILRNPPISQQSATGSVTDGLEVRSASYSDCIKVWLQNNSSWKIERCELFLAGVQRYSERQKEFEQATNFSGVFLIEPQTLGKNKRTKPQNLFVLLKPNSTFLIAFDVHGTRKPVCSVDKVAFGAYKSM